MTDAQPTPSATWKLAVSFFVPGHPRPGGSKTATVIRRKGGEIVMANGRPLVTTRESGKHTKEWRSVVACAAAAAWGGRPLLDCTLFVEVIFTMPRPQSHMRSNGTLKASAPEWHTCKPDATKLLRAMEDALTSVLWRDDSLIASQQVRKVYGQTPGARVYVYTLQIPEKGMGGTPMPENLFSGGKQ